ncbi:hypothetical protein [Limnoglobus roseus]|uniref:Uncharacterized protein n=1 Tax=Limnoglobus roseus TaxID=2598579 RepID=A0A5C1A6Y5_9BACT|nr:hypothetical protein [Limnoglobus roseus]QEL14951.1 hypothetical protein PX52LOC_01854 [Limnoglobus roseus]
MQVDVSESEAAEGLCRVPVCIGCWRPATGVGRVRLSGVNAPTAPAGSTDTIGGILAIVTAVAAIVTWARSDKATITYPACWRHRWVSRPLLRLVSKADGRVRLDGVSPEFHAAWVAGRAT